MAEVFIVGKTIHPRGHECKECELPYPLPCRSCKGYVHAEVSDLFLRYRCDTCGETNRQYDPSGYQRNNL